jgi:hypothetical protein
MSHCFKLAYKINFFSFTRIFGENFVKRNKNKFKIVYNNKEYALKEFFEEIDDKFKPGTEIKFKLRIFHNILNLSEMFFNCYGLLAMKDDAKINTIFVSNNTSLNLPFSDLNSKNENKEVKNMNRQLLKNIFKTQYIRKTLFPFKYYFCSIFIKNFNLNKNYSFLSKKFIVVYDFICQLYDISSYLILLREFQIMKNSILEKKQKNILEKTQKVNVNDHSFQFEMNECLSKNNLSILGKIKQKDNFQ